MTYPILSWALPIALSMLVLAMVLALVRLLKGPSAQDRVLALDCMYLNGMLLALVLGIHYGSNPHEPSSALVAPVSTIAAMVISAHSGSAASVIRSPRRAAKIWPWPSYRQN